MSYINDCKEILSNYRNLKYELINLFEDQLSLEEKLEEEKQILIRVIDYQCYFKIDNEGSIILFSNGNNLLFVTENININNLKNYFRFKERNLVFLSTKCTEVKFVIIKNLNLEKSDIRFKQLYVESEV